MVWIHVKTIYGEKWCEIKLPLSPLVCCPRKVNDWNDRYISNADDNDDNDSICDEIRMNDFSKLNSQMCGSSEGRLFVKMSSLCECVSFQNKSDEKELRFNEKSWKMECLDDNVDDHRDDNIITKVHYYYIPNWGNSFFATYAHIFNTHTFTDLDMSHAFKNDDNSNGN